MKEEAECIMQTAKKEAAAQQKVYFTMHRQPRQLFLLGALILELNLCNLCEI